MSEKRPRGRPQGSKSSAPPIVRVAASRCRKCQSTDRERYFRVIEHFSPGLDVEGLPFTHVVRRWTRCLSCGQVRIDRSVENRTRETPEIVSFPERTGDGNDFPGEARPAA